MKSLSPDSFANARAFLKERARPLERRRFEFLFEGGSPQAVLDELERYQNPDGGFGRSLEPDFRLPDSSPLATGVGLHILREIGAAADQPLVRRAASYLLDAYDPDRGYWPAVPPQVNQVPHAPWWTYDEQAGKTAPETPANPTAELVGCLYRFQGLAPDAFLQQAAGTVLHHLESLPDEMGMHDLICYVRMAGELPAGQQGQVMEKLQRSLAAVVARDPEQWSEYGPQPLQYIDSPQSPFLEVLEDAVQTNLDYRIETQDPGGSWSPNWSWGGDYPQDWEQARQEWQGVLTLETLHSLSSFGRIQEK